MCVHAHTFLFVITRINIPPLSNHQKHSIVNEINVNVCCLEATAKEQ